MHGLGQGGWVGHGARGVDQRGQLGRRVGRQHVRQPRGVVRIGDKPVARVEGKLGRLGLDMGAGGAERVHRADVKVLQDVQQQQRRRALAVRRMFQQLDAAIFARKGRGVIAGGGGQVVQRMGATQRPQRAGSEPMMSSATLPS